VARHVLCLLVFGVEVDLLNGHQAWVESVHDLACNSTGGGVLHLLDPRAEGVVQPPYHGGMAWHDGKFTHAIMDLRERYAPQPQIDAEILPSMSPLDKK